MPGGAIAVASDHAGFDLKEILKRDLQSAGYEVLDLGTHSTQSVDYPDFGAAMGEAIASGRAGRGVLAHNVEAARLSREHNDANVVAFGQRLIDAEVAREALKVFLDTEFEGGRHAVRVAKLSKGSRS